LEGLQRPVRKRTTRETIADDKSGKIHVAQDRKYSCCLDTGPGAIDSLFGPDVA
jgi:hypothetical protein